jgi:Leucine-rich repeat (LRR) protein
MLLTTCILVISGLLVEATPDCQFVNNQRDITCTPGDTDFVIRRGLVSEHDKVTGISLRGCRITEIDYEAFHLLPSLEYLDLSHNKIQTFKLGVLDGFNELKFFNLSYNQITGFPMGLFDSKYNLEILDLKGNRLTNILVGTLYPFKKLRHLDISSNDYRGRQLNSDTFNYSRSIAFMDFSRNDMSNTKENLLAAFTAIDFLNLDRCSLLEVPAFATKPNLGTMKHLLLSTNKIRALGDPENLEILNLEANFIDYITPNVLAPLKKLKRAVFSNNRLKQIPDTLFKNMLMLNEVDMSQNALETLSLNALRGSPINSLIISDNRLSYLPDNFSLELSFSGGRLIKFYFSDNPWQCACLRDILNEMKRFKIVYDNDKYNGRTPVCVSSNDFICKRQ